VGNSSPVQPHIVEEPNVDADFAAAQRVSLAENNEDDDDDEGEPKESNIPVPEADVNEEIVDETKLSEKEKKLLCITCEERFMVTIFLPCQHMMLCVTCSLKHHRTDDEHRCPTCRTPYREIVRPRMAR
jgi:hypothetical protein